MFKIFQTDFGEVVVMTSRKQSSRGVLWKGRSYNMLKIYRLTLCRSVISIKLLWNFIEIALQHGCYPVNLIHIFKTPFYKNTYGGLLLTSICRFFKFRNEKSPIMLQNTMYHKIINDLH